MLHLLRDKVIRTMGSLCKNICFNRLKSTLLSENKTIDKEIQLLLYLKYKEILQKKMPLPSFEDVGFRVFSQNDEDGILLYIFSLIGTVNKKVVEVCAADGIQCNSANLIINHGWTGLLFDGDEEAVSKGKSYYSKCKDTAIFPPQLVHAWIDTENINTLISSHGFQGEIDLLGVDMDGVDYWIWKAIDCIKPRVMVVEYQDIWGAEKSVTVPYKRDFNRFDIHEDYFGASLPAFIKLGREKGYRLVGCNRYGFNAFFVRSGIGEDVLPEVTAKECLKHPKVLQGILTRLPKVMDFDWLEV